jgi:hypothetical protein
VGILSNLVDYVKDKDANTGRDILYNVVYTGKKPKLRKKLKKNKNEE